MSRLSFKTGLLLFIAYLAEFVSCKSSTGNSVLVVIEPSHQPEYSIFFDGLSKRGYDLTFRAPKSESPPVIQDDEAAFSHVVLLSPDTKYYAQDITPQNLVTLLTLNTNLLLFLSSKQTPLSSLAAEFSLSLPAPGTVLTSFFPPRVDAPTVIPIAVTPNPEAPILSENMGPVWFSGVPHAMGKNPLLVPILKALPQSYAADVDNGSPNALVDAAEKGGEGLWAGSQLGLVTGFQTIGGGRVTWVGGVDTFSDRFATKEVSKGVPSGNAQFVKDVSAWTFQESLVLRIDHTEHHPANSTVSKEAYIINDQITFSAHISAYDPVKSAWVPYSGLKDLQLEFTMLDPHIRTDLLPVKGEPGKYSVTFRAPDRHGVFKFVIDYKRKGWTHLHSSTKVPVVPLRHDGHPRFLSAAWPYYAGAISTSVAFVLFSALWLACEIKESKKGKGSKRE